MKNILITAIGQWPQKWNEYKTTNYQFVGSNNKYENLSFVSKAIVEEKEIDQIVFIGTSSSMREEIYKQFWWEDKYYESIFENKVGDFTQDDVDELCQKIWHCGIVIGAWIENDVQEKNMKVLFDKILESISESDLIYYDITHAFRSIPLFVLSILDYLKISKNIKVQSIYYGIFEKTENNITPIVDVTLTNKILEWSKAVDKFLSFGDGAVIAELLKETDSKLSEKFEHITNSFRLQYLSNIQNHLNKLKKMIDESTNIYLFLVKDKIKDFVKRFDITTFSYLQLEFAKWYYENKFYAQSYILLVECLISKQCEISRFDVSDYNQRYIAKWEIIEAEKKGNKNRLFSKINSKRKIVAHASSSANHDNSANEINQIKSFLENVEKSFNSK